MYEGTDDGYGTGEPFLQNGEQITSEVTFVPEAPSGSVEVLFAFDSKLIKTDTNIVVFESLYSDSKELTVHADIKDDEQTVTVIVPEIKTEASIDGKKETTIGGEITIEDIVSYHNLTPGKEYGLAQWTVEDRKTPLLAFANARGCSIADLDMQLAFLCDELETKFPGVLSALKNAKSVREASDYVLFNFEAPLDQSEAVQAQRAANGSVYYSWYGQ